LKFYELVGGTDDATQLSTVAINKCTNKLVSVCVCSPYLSMLIVNCASAPLMQNSKHSNFIAYFIRFLSERYV